MHLVLKRSAIKHHRLAATLLLMALMVYHSALADEEAPWRYNAPSRAEHLATLDPKYALCSAGEQQSPINIEHAVLADLPPLQVRYFRGPATVRHNGHTLEVRTDLKGELRLGNKVYEFEQLHFHTPSGEQIQGQIYPLSAHLVHRDKKGTLAVIAIQFKKGKENSSLAQLLGVMPRHKGDAYVLGQLDVERFMPAQRHYYTYRAGLPVPPCTEKVRWHILKTPVEVSEEQIVAFQLMFPIDPQPIEPVIKHAVRVSG